MQLSLCFPELVKLQLLAISVSTFHIHLLQCMFPVLWSGRYVNTFPKNCISKQNPLVTIRGYFHSGSLLFLTFHRLTASEDTFFRFLCRYRPFTIQSYPRTFSSGSLPLPAFHHPIASEDVFFRFLCRFQLFPICSRSWQHVKNLIDCANTIFFILPLPDRSTHFLTILRSPNLISWI